MTQQKSTILTLSIILLLAVLGGVYFLNQNGNLNSEIDQLQGEAMEFAGLKTGLLSEIEKLQSDYNNLLESNTKLQSAFSDIVAEMRTKNREIEKIKDSASGSSALIDEVKRLRMIKEEYAFVLNELRLQAMILNDSNSELQRQNAELRKRMMAMKRENQQKMQTAISDEELMGGAMPVAAAPPQVDTKMAEKGGPSGEVVVEKKEEVVSIASAKANNITFDIRNKKMQPTDKIKKVRKIGVRFEVNGLQGIPKNTSRLYLVVTDPKGSTVLTEHATRLPLSAMENPKGKPIMAQQVMSSTLKNSRTLKFEFIPLHKALVPGTYTANVYSEMGFMGSRTFELRK